MYRQGLMLRIKECWLKVGDIMVASVNQAVVIWNCQYGLVPVYQPPVAPGKIQPQESKEA